MRPNYRMMRPKPVALTKTVVLMISAKRLFGACGSWERASMAWKRVKGSKSLQVHQNALSVVRARAGCRDFGRHHVERHANPFLIAAHRLRVVIEIPRHQHQIVFGVCLDRRSPRSPPIHHCARAAPHAAILDQCRLPSTAAAALRNKRRSATREDECETYDGSRHPTPRPTPR